MSLTDALLIAAAVTVLCAYFVGEKIINIDISGLLPQNMKKAKMKRLLAERETPLQGMGLHGDVREALEKALRPLSKADKELLPARMDMVFRKNTERQLDLLAQRGLFRDIRLTDAVPLPKNDFKRWSDDGREWREAVLRCSVLERLVSKRDGKPVYELYRKNAYVRLLESRHIRTSDRTEKKKSYYDDRSEISCPSCGAQIGLDSQQAVCPYCGGMIHSDFYDWQTEVFEIYEELGTNQRRALQLLASSLVLFICVFLCLWLIKDTEVSLAAGVGAAALVLATTVALLIHRKTKREKPAGEIVRYSENYLRSCIDEALYKEIKNADLMDHSIGTVILKKVVNTEKTTEITAQIYGREIYLPKNKKPYTKKFTKTLVLQRARYPQRRKGKGELFTERDCPSCGANFIPDEHGCCSFCGYGLQTDNAKWVVKATEK